MHVAVIGTYPPTRCGIATFTADVEQALTDAGVDVTVVPIDPDATCQVTNGAALRSDDRATYTGAARWLNNSGVDIVLIEHEFGIHGGADGSFLLDLTTALTVPYVITLHTVLTEFSATQSATLEALCSRAAAVTVFTATARQMVLEQELATSQAITIVPHGAPVELYRTAGRSLRDELGLVDGAPVLSTFGLLSPGKGLEVAITAMRRIADEVPTARYVIAGRTHPGVQRTDGEQYRADLQALVERLRLEGHVCFVDRFLSVDEIAELLSVTTVFLTPYRNADQIVSGALTFAVAAGCPVVSTPYRYARDLVGAGAGLIVPFDDPASFAAATLTLLRDGPHRHRALAGAAAVSATLSWPAVGRTLRQVLTTALDRWHSERPAQVPAAPAAPRPAPDHLLVMLDDTSVMQHAAYRLPRLEEGYCVDDTARLLPIAARYARERDTGHRWGFAVLRLLAYLRDAERDGDGLMRNFMSWDRRWLDEPHDGDHVARAIWGLGELLQQGQFVDETIAVLQPLVERPVDQPWPRLVAYRTLGLLAAADRMPCDAALAEAHSVVQTWRGDGVPGWLWPEERIVYDAARMPEVMMRLGARLDDRALIERGMDCFAWLERRCREGDHYRFPGHLGLGRGDDIWRSGDEQPLEAAAMIDAACACFELTGDSWAATVAERAWSWFLGNNRLGLQVGSLQTGACHDALTAEGVNLNCGAESTISFHRSALAINRLHSPSEWFRTCSNVTSTTP